MVKDSGEVTVRMVRDADRDLTRELDAARSSESTDLEELTTAEVAEVLGVEPATVRQRVHRARLMLRGYLGALAGGRP